MKRVIVAVAIFLILAAGTALAASPVGQWDYRSFVGPNLTQEAKQGICFLADGTWFSTTFHGWNGLWFQNGDRIRFYGTTGALSTASFGQFISNIKFSGEFANFATSPVVAKDTVGNFFAARTSLTCDSPASPINPSAANDPAVE